MASDQSNYRSETSYSRSRPSLDDSRGMNSSASLSRSPLGGDTPLPNRGREALSPGPRRPSYTNGTPSASEIGLGKPSQSSVETLREPSAHSTVRSISQQPSSESVRPHKPPDSTPMLRQASADPAPPTITTTLASPQVPDNPTLAAPPFDKRRRASFHPQPLNTAFSREVLLTSRSGVLPGAELSVDDDPSEVLRNVEDLLDGFDWTASALVEGGRSRGSADAIEKRLLDELAALDSVRPLFGPSLMSRPTFTHSSRAMIG